MEYAKQLKKRGADIVAVVPSSEESNVSGVRPIISDDERETWLEELKEVEASRWSSAYHTAPVLLRTDSRGCGELIELTEAPLVIGRSSGAAVQIGDGGISRRHAEVTLQGGRPLITDLGSSNGTYVNGRRVNSAILCEGSSVTLGSRVTFRFSLMDEAQREALKYLYEVGLHDSLTQVYNRRYVERHLAGEVAFARRHGAPLSLILFDLDGFKRVNDTHGHPGGDAVLQQFAEVLDGAIRTEDVLARYGGEEFAIVLRGTSLEGAEVLAERLRELVQETPFRVPMGNRLQVTTSIGCAELTCAETQDVRGLLAVAEQRLYHAKRTGKNRVTGSPKVRTRGEQPRTAEVKSSARPELDPQLQLVLSLHYEDGWDLSDIADIMGIDQEQVEQLHARAIKRVYEFRRRFEKN